eukprot:scaffold10141_cov63-Phaeocystis_antarctica.AAC.7
MAAVCGQTRPWNQLLLQLFSGFDSAASAVPTKRSSGSRTKANTNECGATANEPTRAQPKAPCAALLQAPSRALTCAGSGQSAADGLRVCSWATGAHSGALVPEWTASLHSGSLTECADQPSTLQIYPRRPRCRAAALPSFSTGCPYVRRDSAALSVVVPDFHTAGASHSARGPTNALTDRCAVRVCAKRPRASQLVLSSQPRAVQGWLQHELTHAC